MRIAYLGPAGTFSEEALRAAVGEADAELLPQATIHAAVAAVAEGAAERAFVPFENSIEGTVRPTLDALAFDFEEVRIVGEHDHPIRQMLIAARELELDQIERVLSHPQASAQCARFLRAELAGAEIEAASSTSSAVSRVAASDRPWAALGSAGSAAAYGCTILRAGVEDEVGNVTRFVWLAPSSAELPRPTEATGWRTTLVFSELGRDRPGTLVSALAELSERGINMTRIESRPRRSGLGQYLFFVDLEGAAEGEREAAGIAALREQAGSVRILGSYPTGGPAPLQ